MSENSKTLPKTLVVAAAHDEHTLEAVFTAADKLSIRYILVGNREKINVLSSVLGVKVEQSAIIDSMDDIDSARKAVAVIRDKGADALMKGILETRTLLKEVLEREIGIRGTGTLSHLAVLEVPIYKKLIGITDGGMIPHPTLAQKADIAINAATFYRQIGCKTPKIAALCAAESVSPKIQETVDAAELQEMCRRGELGDCLLEGPISFDLSVSKESAKIKGYKGQISGETDILLVPDITVGNVLAKALTYWAGAKMAGCILGAKVPIVLASRGASAEEKLLSIMISTAV
ncbi:MAG: phosphate acyltransferase [Oscillospiraceae bacterium]|nr:phosphate acyltransferase [Oscillospiraceae bacterium]